MRVLVTGGTGYLGRAIVRSLHARGHDTVIFARRARASGLPGTAIDGDVRDQAVLRLAAAGCDAMVHSAALVSLWQPNPAVFDDVNVGGLEHAIAVAREQGFRRLVYTSSFLAEPPAGRAEPLHANDYQRTKARALSVARRAQSEGVPIVVLVPGVVYGPGVRTEGNLVGRLLADRVARRLPGIVGAARTWSFAFVDDVASSHVAALEAGTPARQYALGGQNLPQRVIFEWLRDRTGLSLPRDIPAWAASMAGTVQEWRAALTGQMPLVTRGAVEIFRHDWPLDSSDASHELGHRIRPLSEGLDVTAAELAIPARREEQA
jgi:farnesol dehydrogenase